MPEPMKPKEKSFKPGLESCGAVILSEDGERVLVRMPRAPLPLQDKVWCLPWLHHYDAEPHVIAAQAALELAGAHTRFLAPLDGIWGLGDIRFFLMQVTGPLEAPSGATDEVRWASWDEARQLIIESQPFHVRPSPIRDLGVLNAAEALWSKVRSLLGGGQPASRDVEVLDAAESLWAKVRTEQDSARWGPALEAAIVAAKAAGAHQRELFHRPPTAAEQNDPTMVERQSFELIEASLRTAFPEWPVSTSDTGTGLRWCVLPLDGVDAFRDGHRGTSLSIVLLDGDRPVVAVVYAPLAPDDDGDLFAWAEGRPLVRNRWALDVRAWPELSTAHSFLFPLCIDPRDWSTSCDPARPRTVPGATYRYALVAAGDAEVAVSSFEPSPAELVAGRALLTAAGGLLGPLEGTIPTYGHALHVAGRTAWVEEKRSSAIWTGFHRKDGTEPLERAFDLLLPTRGMSCADAEVLRRAQGALVGLVAGGSFGTPFDGRSRDEVLELRRLEGFTVNLHSGGAEERLAGQPIPLVEQALMLARQLVAIGRFDADQIAGAYGLWAQSRSATLSRQDPDEVTSSTIEGLKDALRFWQRGGRAAEEARRRASPESLVDEALVRIAPLGIFGWAVEPALLAKWARQDAALTHANPVVQDAAILVACTVAHAIRTGVHGEALHQWAAELVPSLGLDAQVRIALEASKRWAVGDTRWPRAATETLRNAFHQVFAGVRPIQGVPQAVREGEGASRSGAVTGALLGAAYGLGAIPVSWTDRVLTCRASQRRQRPRSLWAVDALELAERLVVAGRRVA